MNLYVATFLRGFAIVCATSANVAQIAARHYLGAFCCGFLISYLWWKSARGAAHDDLVGLRETYAAGAACGTVFGIWIVHVLYA